MRNYLEQADTAFYHITKASNWESIKENGLTSPKGLFVVQTNNPGVINSIALSQLAELDGTPPIAIIKLSQELNNFTTEEISVDMQSNEPTMPLHNIIYRTHIPAAALELVEIRELDVECTRLAMLSDDTIAQTAVYLNALNLIYERTKPCFRLTGVQEKENVDCPDDEVDA